MQYCGVNSPTKLIPFSESQLSSCTGDGYRYCDSYLTLARPHGTTAPPADLLYSPNHFWLATEESGLCHIGIDAFLAEFVGKFDGMTFVTTHGTQQPVVAVTVHGVEWPMTFPNPLMIQKVNGHLRSDPKRLTCRSVRIRMAIFRMGIAWPDQGGVDFRDLMRRRGRQKKKSAWRGKFTKRRN